MHRTSIHKKLLHCLASYRQTKFRLFQGSEGRQRAAAFEKLLKRYEMGFDSDLKPIYTFYLNQNDNSKLRNMIKFTLCDMLNIQLQQPQMCYVSPNAYHYQSNIFKMMQEQQLNEKLYSYITDNCQVEMEMQPLRNP
jgi:hypothetical protein